MSSNPLMMGYGGGDLLRTGTVWSALGLLPRPVCAGCGRWLVWPAAPGRDESALEVAPLDRQLDRRPTAFTTMRHTNRQPLPFFTFTWSRDVSRQCTRAAV